MSASPAEAPALSPVMEGFQPDVAYAYDALSEQSFSHLGRMAEWARSNITARKGGSIALAGMTAATVGILPAAEAPAAASTPVHQYEKGFSCIYAGKGLWNVHFVSRVPVGNNLDDMPFTYRMLPAQPGETASGKGIVASGIARVSDTVVEAKSGSGTLVIKNGGGTLLKKDGVVWNCGVTPVIDHMNPNADCIPGGDGHIKFYGERLAQVKIVKFGSALANEVIHVSSTRLNVVDAPHKDVATVLVRAENGIRWSAPKRFTYEDVLCAPGGF